MQNRGEGKAGGGGRSFWRLSCARKNIFLPVWQLCWLLSVTTKQSCISPEKIEKLQWHPCIWHCLLLIHSICKSQKPHYSYAKSGHSGPELLNIIQVTSYNDYSSWHSDTKAVQMNCQLTSMYEAVNMCVHTYARDWEKKCISLEAATQQDLFWLQCAVHSTTLLHASLPQPKASYCATLEHASPFHEPLQQVHLFDVFAV